MFSKRSAVLGLFLLIMMSAFALSEGKFEMPAYYGDGMVFQRGRPLQILGRASAGTPVEVRFDGRVKRAKAGKDGQWRVTFGRRGAGGPYSLEVKAGDERLSYSDVWIGELWLCSGQSNMEFRLRDCLTATEDLAAASAVASRLHLYNMEVVAPTDGSVWNEEVLARVNARRYFLPARWQRANPEAAARFSAVAYHFGRVLADSLGLHVGLVLNAVGGAAAESWTDSAVLRRFYPEMLAPWETNELVQDWVRGRALHNCGGRTADRQSHPYHVGYLFESGLSPLCGLQPAGVIWYQGESNAHDVAGHERLFPLLVKSWRDFFHSPRLPFLFVQLSSIAPRATWPAFRDSQRRLARRVHGTSMIVCSDLGDSLDVHPRRKRPVGERLARAALVGQYGFPLVPCGPVLARVRAEGRALRLTFRYGEGLKAADGGELRGFEVADGSGVFRPARAVADGTSVVLTAPDVERPTAVRYGWQPFTRANLVNKDGLPASTFRYPEQR